jgi:membrane-associated phospholipid phosphatase
MTTTHEGEHRTNGLRVDELVALARRVAMPMTITLVVATALSVAVGLLVVHSLVDSVGQWDLRVVENLAADRTTAVDRITGWAAVFADTVPVAALWVGAMALGARLTGQWVVPMFFLFVIGGEKLTYLVTSMVVGRPRPPVEALGHVFATSSFPSGHVGSAVALYGSIVVAILWHRFELGRPLPAWPVVVSAVAVVAITVSVAFSRTYRAQHYPSDVVWGALMGVVWLVAGWRLVLVAESRRRAVTRRR